VLYIGLLPSYNIREEVYLILNMTDTDSSIDTDTESLRQKEK